MTRAIARRLLALLLLHVLVLPAAPAAAQPVESGRLVFIEAEVDASAPYVQQAVGYVVRLYLGVPLVSGELDQAEPEGATLQRVGEDVRYSRELGGRRYTVIERHYLMVPERSGPLEVPGARFRGRGAVGFFDDFLGSDDALEARGATQRLQVRAVPDAAAQPWLPLHGFDLRWTSTPGRARVGAAATVVLEARADGAMAAQLPALELPPIDGAQVFADPVELDERFVNGRPRATARRMFSIVPAREGELRIEAPRLAWWDVGDGVARSASAPALSIAVAPGAPVAVADPLQQTGRPRAASSRTGWRGLRVPGIQDPVRPWALATVLFALAWLLTLAWGLQRRPRGAEADQPSAALHAATGGPGLPRALKAGDLADIGDALCAAASPPASGLDGVLERLDDPVQRDAVAQLQRARWNDGDPAMARAALRAAFKSGPRWRKPAATAGGVLPPLYP